MTFFGLKYSQDLENRAVHPHQEFPRVPPGMNLVAGCMAVTSCTVVTHSWITSIHIEIHIEICARRVAECSMKNLEFIHGQRLRLFVSTMKNYEVELSNLYKTCGLR